MSDIKKFDPIEEHQKFILYTKTHPVRYFISRISWQILNFFGEIKRTPKYIKWFIQRGTRGWADCDTWCLGGYLSKVIRDALVYYRRNTHGYFTYDETLSDKDNEKRCNDLLNKMIEAFDCKYKINMGDYYAYFPGMDEEWKKKHSENFGCKFLTEAEQNEINAGIQLFITHFDNLWD